MGILEATKAQVALNELVAKAHPGFKTMLAIQRPRTRQTITEMLNSELVTPDGKNLKKSLEEGDKKVQDLLRYAYNDMANGVRSEATEFLNTVRRRVVDVGMWSKPGWFMFYDFIRLANDERPQIQQDYENEFPVIILGQEMGVETRRYVKENLSFQPINMVFRSTPEIIYTILNPNTGQYMLNKPKMTEMERAHSYNLNEMCGDAANAAIGTFPTALGEQSYLLHNQDLLHSSFKNVPTTNDIDLSGEGSITKEVFLAIIDYMDRMPSFGEGQDFNRTINAIVVPSVDRIQLNRFISVTSGFDSTSPPDPENVFPGATFSPAFQQQLEAQGFPSQMFGTPFTLVVDKTLPANALYVSFSQAAGTVWEKPGMTMAVDRVEMEKNRGIVKLLKVYQVTVEPHQLPNILKVTYNT